jgi:SAM-dependent methyltransferase
MNDPMHPDAGAYASRLAAENRIYRDDTDVHRLPAIFHYWSNRYVRPKLEAFGFSTPEGMYRKYLGQQFERDPSRPKRFVSFGCGNCNMEIELAQELRARGGCDFVIDCVDLNPAMLERGRVSAAEREVTAHLGFVQADFNQWAPEHEYDSAIANQALHHVLNLEGLFAQIKSSLRPHGTLILSELVGRNGHQRWPEALEIVHEFWRKLPPSYRFNRKLQRYEEMYRNYDCSGDGFEGIRSQDILSLLLENFHFQVFVAFANVIDPFVDRAFGPNFDPDAPWDRSFIDAVQQRDEEEFAAGRIKPTQRPNFVPPAVDSGVLGSKSATGCRRARRLVKSLRMAGVAPRSASRAGDCPTATAKQRTGETSGPGAAAAGTVGSTESGV